MFKCRIACVLLAVVCLAGLGITLYADKTPSMSAAWFFACTCITALVGNALLSVLELNRASLLFQRRRTRQRRLQLGWELPEMTRMRPGMALTLPARNPFRRKRMKMRNNRRMRLLRRACRLRKTQQKRARRKLHRSA